MTELPDSRKPDASGIRYLPPDKFEISFAAGTRTLAPCPFCGGQALVSCRVNDRTKIVIADVHCPAVACMAKVFAGSRKGRSSARNAAIAKWNRRV